MADPSPAERALLDVYLSAEQALMRQATATYRALVNSADEVTEAQRRADGLIVVQRATAGIVRQLDGAIPGLLGEIITAASARGTEEAVRQLGALTGPNLYADRPVNRGALDRLAATLIGRADEAHRAILRAVPDAYRQAVARVLPASLVGVETRRQTAQRAWWDLATRGLTRFLDASGRPWRLSSYVEMAARTASARATLDAQHDRLAAAGRDLVIVQGSGDRCERCRPWHGRVLSIGGSGRGTVRVEHPTRDGEFVDVEIAGSVADARADGWGHPQCRCGTAAYLPGITRPTPLRREDDGAYEARQRQRAIERQIRAAKERELVALDDAAADRSRQQVLAAQVRMREHLDAHPDLLRRPYREQLGAGSVPAAVRRAGV